MAENHKNHDKVNILTFIVSLLAALFTIGTVIVGALGVKSFLDSSFTINNYSRELDRLKGDYMKLTKNYTDNLKELRNDYETFNKEAKQEYRVTSNNIKDLKDKAEREYEEFKTLKSEISKELLSMKNNINAVREMIFNINSASESVSLDRDIDSLEPYSIRRALTNLDNAKRVFSQYIINGRQNNNEYSIELSTEASWNLLKLIKKSGEKLRFKEAYKIYLINLKNIEKLTSNERDEYCVEVKLKQCWQIRNRILNNLSLLLTLENKGKFGYDEYSSPLIIRKLERIINSSSDKYNDKMKFMIIRSISDSVGLSDNVTKKSKQILNKFTEIEGENIWTARRATIELIRIKEKKGIDKFYKVVKDDGKPDKQFWYALAFAELETDVIEDIHNEINLEDVIDKTISVLERNQENTYKNKYGNYLS